MVSPCSPDCPRTCYVEQAGNNSRDFPAPASLILGLKVCINMPSQKCSSSPNFLCQMFSLGTPSGLVLAGTPPRPTLSVSSSFPLTQHTPCDLAILKSGSQPPCIQAFPAFKWRCAGHATLLQSNYAVNK